MSAFSYYRVCAFIEYSYDMFEIPELLLSYVLARSESGMYDQQEFASGT